MASGAYPLAIGGPLTGSVDYDTDTFYVLLVTSTYTPNFDTHDYRDDITNEVAATGNYVAGGFSVTVTVGAFNTGTNKYTVTLGAKTIASSTITARGAVYYKRRGGLSSADELIGFNDFGSDVISTAGDFVISASTFDVELNAA